MKEKIERHACIRVTFFKVELSQLADGLDVKDKKKEGLKNGQKKLMLDIS